MPQIRLEESIGTTVATGANRTEAVIASCPSPPISPIPTSTAHVAGSCGWRLNRYTIPSGGSDSAENQNTVVAAGSVRPIWRSRIAITATSRSEEHTSELQSLMRISYAVFCLQKKHQN